MSRTGKYRVCDTPICPLRKTDAVILNQTSIYVGFAAWAVGCGCLSTVRAGSTTKAHLVVYMLLSGMGAGQVRLVVKFGLGLLWTHVFTQTLQTTTVAAQASVPRRDMSVVTAVRNVSWLPDAISRSLRSYLSTISSSGCWEGHWV